MAEPLGVQVALEVMGNSLSTAPGLIEILERRFEGTDLGICMDVGHLVPFQGSLNWAATVMAFEKIGYDGVLMYEVRDAETPRAVLAKAVSARRRLEGLMVDSSQLSADRL